jgi:hypothetical protein
MNLGDNDSLLNWAVNNTMTWGTWTFSHTSGSNVTPEQGPVTVDVHVVIPKEKNTKFQGNLTIQNTDNASDVATIPVTLTTTASGSISIPFQLFWQRIFERFPYAFLILQHLLGYEH